MQTVSANGQTIFVYNVTGKIEDAGKNLETKMQGTSQAGYAGAQVSIRSKTVVHDQFFITDDAGQEHSFQLQDFDVACRSGNRASVLWAVKKGKKKGPYIAVYNHSTSTAYYNNKAMAALFRRPVLQLAGVVLLLLLLGNVAPFFYWLIPAAVVLWLAEGSISTGRFKQEFNFAALNHPPTAPSVEQGSQPVLPAAKK